MIYSVPYYILSKMLCFLALEAMREAARNEGGGAGLGLGQLMALIN
jgi:hypothetical protein